MDSRRHRRKQDKTAHFECEEVSSNEWELIRMSAQEQDLIFRMYKLVGQRWDLIAGRIPGRKPEEIERYWIMSHLHDQDQPSFAFADNEIGMKLEERKKDY